MDNMDSIWGFIGIVVFVCGIYALYAFIKMKTTGEINASLLLGKTISIKSVKIKMRLLKRPDRPCLDSVLLLLYTVRSM